MKYYSIYLACLTLFTVSACKNSVEKSNTGTADSNFVVAADSFADLQILRYQVPGFNELSLQQKQLAYFLQEAGLSGRDIIYDQKGKYNLLIRKTLENIYATYKGDQTTTEWAQFKTYAGRFWFSNGNHHHYGNE